MGNAEIVAQVRARIGWRSEGSRSLVEEGHVRRFCEAIGDDNPRWREEAPPTFAVALAADTPQIPEALAYGKGWLNAGDRFEYLEPIRIGDEIESRTVLVDAYEKQGSSGNLLFLVFETEFQNQKGRTAVRLRGTRIRR
jgi:hypothetical protein